MQQRRNGVLQRQELVEYGPRSQGSNAIDLVSLCVGSFRCVRAGMAVARACDGAVQYGSSARTTPTILPISIHKLPSHDRGKGMCQIPRPAFAPRDGWGARFIQIDAILIHPVRPNNSGSTAQLAAQSDSDACAILADDQLPSTPDWRLKQWAGISCSHPAHEPAEPA
eukprot:6207047-Pleurochrysis_carterae.AAC.3